MKIRPLNNKVVIRLNRESHLAECGLVKVNQPSLLRTGEVVAVGPRVTEVEVGDEVQLFRISGTQIKINGHVHEVVHEPDIIAIL
jgi:co-chaperonin GroES (HSP10)